MRYLSIFVLFTALLAFSGAWAQEEDRSDNGYIVRLIEDSISSPNMHIRLNGIEGALSSSASIEKITIADREGTWLTILDAALDWNRTALLAGRIDIEKLAAREIRITRRPVPDDSLPTAEASSFALPELPVGIELEALDVVKVVLDESVLGAAADLRVTGSISLSDGALDLALVTDRLDRSGDRLSIAAQYANSEQRLKIDLDLAEAQGGLFSTLANIPGQPSMELTVAGEGPINDLRVEMNMSADGRQLVTGSVILNQDDGGALGFTADVLGDIKPLVPADFQSFFEEPARLGASGTQTPDGGFDLSEFGIANGAVDLTGHLRLAADGFPTELLLQGQVGQPGGGRTLLPFAGADTSLQSALLDLRFGQDDRLQGKFDIDAFTSGGLTMETLSVSIDGTARNLRQAGLRQISGELAGRAAGLSSTDRALSTALGDAMDLSIDLDWTEGTPLVLNTASFRGAGAEVDLSGTLNDRIFNGALSAEVPELALFSGLAGRTLTGETRFSARGSVSPLTGGFDLVLDGEAQDISLGDARLDGLLAGQSTLSGQITRSAEGIAARAFQVANPQVSLVADGLISSTETGMGLRASLRDIGLLSEQVSGKADLTADITGTGGPLTLSATLGIASGTLDGQTLRAAEMTFNGTAERMDKLSGTLEAVAELSDLAAKLSGDIMLDGGLAGLPSFTFTAGQTRLDGSVLRGTDGLTSGRVTLRSPDIGPAGKLFLLDANGAVDADILLYRKLRQQQVDLRGDIRNLSVAGVTIGRAETELAIEDALGLPLIDGDMSAETVIAGGIEMTALTATARSADNAMDVTARARLAQGTDIDLEGRLAEVPDGIEIALFQLNLVQREVAARLRAPAQLTIGNGSVVLTPLSLDVADGRIALAGQVGETLDLALDIDALPLSIANTIRSDLGVEGRIDGSAQVGGTSDAPDISFDLAARQLSAAAVRALGLPALTVTATGQTDTKTLALSGALTDGGAFQATVEGDVPLGADGALDLDVVLQSLPLAMIDRLAGSIGLGGTVTGEAKVTGPLADPEAAFSLQAGALSAPQMRSFGLTSVAATVTGTANAQELTLQNAQVTAPDGIDVRASGNVPLSGGQMAVDVSGTAPLGLTNIILADRGSQMAGRINLNATVRGQLSSPRVDGAATIRGATAVDPQSNLRIDGIDADLRMTGENVVLERLSGRFSRGGTISINGQVAISAARNFPGEFTVALRNARYTDGDVVTTTLNGDISISGPLAGAGAVSGQIDVGRTEVTIPDGFGLSEAALLDVTHINTPPRVRFTLDRAKALTPEDPGSAGPGLALNVTISAPNQVYIRGRGLDAEMGGQVRILGTSNDVQPLGGLSLIRGRLSLLGQRITFDEGEITLIGSLDPQIRLVASSETDDATVFVTVSGLASDPDIVFSSDPELPEDEVLALLIFQRNLSELSAFQIAQLAGAAASLRGGGGGVLGALRNSVNLDDLDFTTADDGTVGVKAGKYLRDNIYLDVESTSAGDTTATINLDITDSLTARGSVDTDGESSIGIFFERDY